MRLQIYWLKFVTLFSVPAAFVIVVSCGNSSIEYYKNIAPILAKNCMPCHRDNGIAPFSLTSYEAVKKRAKTIVSVTQKRYMPPWPADPNYSHFVGEKYLSQEQIELIATWYKQGAKAGNEADFKMPNLSQYSSQIGKPDLTLELDEIELKNDGKDRFFLMKIPGKIEKDTWVRSIEFIAGQPKYLHHFNGHVLLYDEGKKKNLFSKPTTVEITEGEYDLDFQKLNLVQDDGSKPQRVHSAVNYLPGVLGFQYPDGFGNIKLTKQFAIIGNDVHYGPSSKNVKDKSKINIFFSKLPPKRQLQEIMLGTNGVSKIVPPLQIEANSISTHTTQFTVPADISILTINPHLHNLGKTFLAYAIKPNGDTIRLIKIPNWDIRWQYFYTFKTMVKIPKGSEIVCIATFDNTSNNPNNPNNPPKKVGERLEFGGASMRASDEMFQFIITYTPYNPGDEEIQLE